MKTFFTADWHLGEDRLELLQRPFKSIDEHIDALVERHNSVVKPEDEVFVVGDAVYRKSPEYVDHISRFNGKKTLIRGNHDELIDNATFLKYFDAVIDHGHGLEMYIYGIPCWITHYPSQGKKDMFNLVGHIHSAWKYQLNMFNVGVDVNHFFPVPAEKIKFHFDAVVNYYDGDIWIAYSEINSVYCGKRGKSSFYFKLS
jgi:calcineurin-like phosphoesterase family protein